MISASTLPEEVKRKSIDAFLVLAEAEAKVHGVDISDVHFHEVGAVDSIIDTVGIFLALHLLKIDRVYASELPFSQGMVNTQHGLLSVPAPATMNVLAGTGAIFRPTSLRGELVTPTGAAFLASASLDFGNPPPFTPVSTGCGAGTKDFEEQPNVLRVIVGQLVTSHKPTTRLSTLKGSDQVRDHASAELLQVEA